ncbi:hypothetical protein RRG08_053188 [Elysia crispata]|uniref:Uncharacterized protein n=1 Tax=Elysia crispata TaxID=231223 RepID=A0AAE1D3I7_9GAST|nr:hypothetical protein RRG08_053188 [Elysia crispata]
MEKDSLLPIVLHSQSLTICPRRRVHHCGVVEGEKEEERIKCPWQVSEAPMRFPLDLSRLLYQSHDMFRGPQGEIEAPGTSTIRERGKFTTAVSLNETSVAGRCRDLDSCGWYLDIKLNKNSYKSVDRVRQRFLCLIIVYHCYVSSGIGWTS